MLLKIIDLSGRSENAEILKGRMISNGDVSSESSLSAACEHLAEVSVNGVPVMRLVCTRDHLPELVIGRLLSEGMVDGPEDLELIYVCEQGTRISAVVKREPIKSSDAFAETTGTCCTGNRLLTDAFIKGAPLMAVTPVAWEPGDLMRAVKEMRAVTPLFDQTHSVHSCGLLHGGTLHFCCEDIGRHNAVDKVIGCAVREGINLRECILLSSGRIASDMAEKAIRAGIPVFATTKSATDVATRMAAKYGLTIAVYVREDRITVLSAEDETS